MFHCCSCNSVFIPEEYRGIAQALFPPDLSEGSGGPEAAEDGAKAEEKAFAFAGILGIGADYRRLLDLEEYGPEMKTFLQHFRNNLELLIQKTWVEEADVERKQELEDQIPGLMAKIEGKDYLSALTDFSVILEELAWLFFGPQSRKEDFAEYAFRIDAQMGLFWWYGTQIGRTEEWARWKPHITGQAMFRAVLLIGLCYLTNF
ncbi:MAG: hypothetical protein LBL64_03855 [Treponema sp.]|jgi:hypothetical protein|nr:hypothetical protein [Treponema sp.]